MPNPARPRTLPVHCDARWASARPIIRSPFSACWLPAASTSCCTLCAPRQRKAATHGENGRADLKGQVCACVRACVGACVCGCVGGCVRACVRVCMCARDAHRPCCTQGALHFSTKVLISPADTLDRTPVGLVISSTSAPSGVPAAVTTVSLSSAIQKPASRPHIRPRARCASFAPDADIVFTEAGCNGAKRRQAALSTENRCRPMRRRATDRAARPSSPPGSDGRFGSFGSFESFGRFESFGSFEVSGGFRVGERQAPPHGSSGSGSVARRMARRAR